LILKNFEKEIAAMMLKNVEYPWNLECTFYNFT